MRLTCLTAEQEALIPVVRERWIDFGLSTEPADRSQAEEGVREAYRQAGLVSPETIIWVESPLEGSQKVAELGIPEVTGNQVRTRVIEDVSWEVDTLMRDQAAGGVIEQIWEQIHDEVYDQIVERLRDHLEGPIWGAGYGQHHAASHAVEEFMQECGVEGPERLAGLTQVAQHAGWWWPFERVVVMTERHSVVHFDDAGRLHCEDGPAVAYPDGWGIWMIHGVQVPQRVVENPESILVEEINREWNAEVRRVMIDRYGMERYLHDADAELVDAVTKARFKGMEGARLWRLKYESVEPLTVVECRNSTPEPDGSSRTYWLRVPPGMKSAHEALAWTFGETKQNYRPEAES